MEKEKRIDVKRLIESKNKKIASLTARAAFNIFFYIELIDFTQLKAK